MYKELCMRVIVYSSFFYAKNFVRKKKQEEISDSNAGEC